MKKRTLAEDVKVYSAFSATILVVTLKAGLLRFDWYPDKGNDRDKYIVVMVAWFLVGASL